RILLPLFLLFTLSLSSQPTALTALLEQAQAEIVTVETAKNSYEQSLTFNADKPWEITVTVSETSLKNGKGETLTYDFNLSDLDARLVNYKDERDEQTVVLRTRGKKSLIRETDEDGDVTYRSELSLWSPEIDRAKALRDPLREAIPLATELWEADFNPGSTLSEIHAWLADNLVAVTVSDKDYDVTWENDTDLPDHATLTVSEDGAEQYYFSLADLGKNALSLKVRKSDVYVEMGTVGRRKLIRVTEDEELKPYDDAISIPVTSVDAARKIISSLESALPLAKEAREARMPQATDLSAGLKQLSALVTGAEQKGKKLSAELSAEAVTNLSITSVDTDKGEEETNRFLFAFADLEPNKIALKVRSTALNVVATVKGGKNYVQRWENGEADGFTDEIAIPVPSVEAARQLEALLPSVIKAAAELPVETGDFSWFQSTVSESGKEEITQTLEENGDACKWKLTVVEAGKKEDEMEYEFNLYDLDPKRIDFNAGSKGILLEVTTRKSEEIINVLDNGEPEFTDELPVRFSSILAAKKAKASLRKMIEGCSED
ncbi:MAG: hypothetical protein AAFN92_09370, partial [Bacteroidota bacterium]